MLAWQILSFEAMCILEFYAYFRHSVSILNVLNTMAGKASFGDVYKGVLLFSFLFRQYLCFISFYLCQWAVYSRSLALR